MYLPTNLHLPTCAYPPFHILSTFKIQKKRAVNVFQAVINNDIPTNLDQPERTFNKKTIFKKNNVIFYKPRRTGDITRDQKDYMYPVYLIVYLK